MAKRQVKNQKTNQSQIKKETGPSAAEFLQQPANQSNQLEPKAATKIAKPEQEPEQNVREIINVSTENKQISSGDPCGSGKKCPGKYRVLSSLREGNRRTRYFACSICNFKPKNNKEVTYIP